MKRVLLSLFFVCVPLLAQAAETQADILPSMQRLQHSNIRMFVPSGWRELTVGSLESNYTLYTPLPKWNALDYITGIHVAQIPFSTDFSTPSAASRSLESANPNIRILSTKTYVNRGNLSGFDIEFATDCKCGTPQIHQWWRFYVGKDSVYVVGLNGSERMYQRLKPLFRGLLRTLVIRE